MHLSAQLLNLGNLLYKLSKEEGGESLWALLIKKIGFYFNCNVNI